MSSDRLLIVRDLSVSFRNKEKSQKIVDRLSLCMGKGEITAIIGESGCGKSVAAHAMMRLLPPSAQVTGSVIFQGRELLSLQEREINQVRGENLALIFQSPDRSLNPLYPIGRQIREPIMVHCGEKILLEKYARQAASFAGFSEPDAIMAKYPCFCSGGMNQRAVLAVASALMPALLIADEPTKGLDPSRIAEVEASLLRAEDRNRAILLITHDIALAERIAQRLLVMYAGEVIESGPAEEILSVPSHPYTQGLLGSLPRNGFVPIPGSSPPISDIPTGCRFHPRCTKATEQCRREHPDLLKKNNREVRCWLSSDCRE